MNSATMTQFYSFLTFTGIGIIIVLLFDIFRIFRKSFKTSDIITYIEDIVFLLIASFILFYSIFKLNNRRNSIICVFRNCFRWSNLYFNH